MTIGRSDADIPIGPPKETEPETTPLQNHIGQQKPILNLDLDCKQEQSRHSAFLDISVVMWGE